MEKFFAQKDKKFSFNRSFHHISKEQIKHFTSKSVCHTLDGIKQHYCFLITRSKDIYYRRLTCCCHWCMSLSWTRCCAVSVCGPWERHIWRRTSSESSSVQQVSNNSSPVCAVPPMVQGTAIGYYYRTTHSNSGSSTVNIPALDSNISSVANHHNQSNVQQLQFPMYNAYHSPSQNLYNYRFPY